MKILNNTLFNVVLINWISLEERGDLQSLEFVDCIFVNELQIDVKV